MAKSGKVPWAPLVAGAVVFLAGAAVAFRTLPEERGTPRDARLVERIRKDLEGVGGRLTRPRLGLAERPDPSSAFERAYRRLGTGARDYLERTGGSLAWTVKGTLEVGGGGVGPVEIAFFPTGELQSFRWITGTSFSSFFQSPEDATRAARDAFMTRVESLFTRDRPRTGAEFPFTFSNTIVRVRPLVPKVGWPAETLVEQQPANALILLNRELADPEAARVISETLIHELYRAIPLALLVLLTMVLFGVRLFRRRLGFRIALVLGGLAGLTMMAVGVPTEKLAGGGPSVTFFLVGRLAMVAFLICLWAVSESLLRDTVPGFTTSLDSFAAGRLTPRGGNAVLAGLGLGAAVAGSQLLLFSLGSVAVSSGVHPTGPSLSFPFFQGSKNPFFAGAFDAALLVLLIALLRFVLSRRWANTAGALLFALLLSLRVPMAPWGAALAVSLVVAALFYFSFDRYGFAALLVAAVSAPLLRDALAAVHVFPEGLLSTFVVFAWLAGLVIVGFVAVARPEREDEGRVEAPHYVRRIESERRVKYEMDLLSRMQLSLLPERPPSVPGLELAVKTVLATEAGGDLFDFILDGTGELWLAAGDVSGHGYSCGIQQAMAMAALASLVPSGRRPSEILKEIDRVLRAGRAGRLFTSLALLRLNPKTGRALLANAGHPFPLLLTDGTCREIVLGGLPLGQGPPRTYEDVSLELAPGAALVFASDGLFEGVDRFDEPYGYERPRAVLESTSLWRRPAESIIEALFADWRLHVGEGAPADDTTIVAVKRPPF